MWGCCRIAGTPFLASIRHRSIPVFAKPANLAKGDAEQGARGIRNILMPVSVGMVFEVERSGGRESKRGNREEPCCPIQQEECLILLLNIFSSSGIFFCRSLEHSRGEGAPFWRDVVWQTEKVWKNTPCPSPVFANPANLANTFPRPLSHDSQHSHARPRRVST